MVLAFISGGPLAAQQFQAPLIEGSFQVTPPTYQLPDNPKPSLDELITGLKAAAQKNRQDASAWYQLGLAYFANEQYDEAADCLKDAVQLKADSSIMWTDLAAMLAREMSPPDDMVDDLRTAVHLDPQNIPAWVDCIAYYRIHGSYEEARALVDQAQETNPHSADLWNSLGCLDFQQSESDAAISDFQKALDADPSFANADFNIGTCLATRSSYPEAIDAYTKGIELKPDAKVGWSLMAAVIRQAKSQADGVTKVEALLKDHPDAESGWGVLGLLQNDLGANADALVSLQKALQLDPKDSTVWTNIGISYVGLQQTDKSIDAFRQAVKLSPNNGMAWNDLGYHELLAGQTQQAIADLNRSLQYHAVDNNESVERALVNLVNAYNLTGQSTLAHETCDRLEKIDPDAATNLRAQIK